MLVELDFLVALARSDDRRHGEVVKLLELRGGDLVLSPYALVELNLLVWSNILRVREPSTFFRLLNDVLIYYRIEEIKPSVKHIAKAYELRAKYGLTFFDGLHGAVAVVESIPIVSYDKSYSKVGELRYIHPSTLL